MDADLTMPAHVTAIVQACFATLWQIRSVRHSLPSSALLTMLCALVISKLDYCNMPELICNKTCISHHI